MISLHILHTSLYLLEIIFYTWRRLWCIFELAAFLRSQDDNPSGSALRFGSLSSIGVHGVVAVVLPWFWNHRAYCRILLSIYVIIMHTLIVTNYVFVCASNLYFCIHLYLYLTVSTNTRCMKQWRWNCRKVKPIIARSVLDVMKKMTKCFRLPLRTPSQVLLRILPTFQHSFMWIHVALGLQFCMRVSSACLTDRRRGLIFWFASFKGFHDFLNVPSCSGTEVSGCVCGQPFWGRAFLPCTSAGQLDVSHLFSCLTHRL